jgi:hypothetical protein
MTGGGPASDEHHRRQLDRLRTAARRARLLARPDAADPRPVPEAEHPRPELDIFARHLRKRTADNEDEAEIEAEAEDDEPEE